MTLGKNHIAVPAISPSSQLRKKGEPIVGPFQFTFEIHSPSGALLFLPQSDGGYIEAVRGAQHREPESHIDQISSQIAELIASMGRDIRDMKICGLSDKDFSMVKALEPLEGQSASILFPFSHCLEVEGLFFESLSNAKKIDVDLIIARHIIEHVRDVDKFLMGLREALRPGAMGFIEVPDCTRMLTLGDITQLWEEHTAYFTPSTLRALLEASGFDILYEENLTSDGEDLCVLVVQVASQASTQRTISASPGCEMGFLDRLQGFLENLSAKLAARNTTHNVWLYGANHTSGVFLDVVDYSRSQIRGIIDDDPSKKGQVISTRDIEVHSYDALLGTNPVCVLVAISEGRSPALYARLVRDFPRENGHLVQSLASFSEDCWEEEK